MSNVESGPMSRNRIAVADDGGMNRAFFHGINFTTKASMPGAVVRANGVATQMRRARD